MPKYNNPRKTWRYADEFKIRAVEISYQEGIQIQQVAEGLGIHPFMLSRWRKEYREGKIRSDSRKRVSVMKNPKTPSVAELNEMARLKRENDRLKKENDLLKKWRRYLAEQHQSDLDSSKPTGGELGVRYLCTSLGVSRSGCYAWLKRPASARALEDRWLSRRIERAHQKSEGRYGSPRVHKVLARQGVRVGEKRVEHIMWDAGLVGRAATLYRRIPGLEKLFDRYQNLRVDAGPPTAVDQQWVAIWVAKEWRYLATVMDVYSRKIVGWSLGKNKTAELALRTQKQALKAKEPKSDMIFHSDSSSEYRAHMLQNELERHGIRCSMNRPGRCTDNGHMESFFHSLKAELIHGEEFRNETELRLALSGYINQFYNRSRLHSALGYLSPVEFERMAA
jgi:transposase InsO family protein/transposase-like protein